MSTLTLSVTARRLAIAEIQLAAQPTIRMKFRRYWRTRSDADLVQHHAALMADLRKYKLEVKR